ncbi:MAG: 50S ribosomal protein L10 [Candidatus Micrarchaeaceae archaeon]
MLSKNQKIEFVNNVSKDLKAYNSIGIINLNGVPDSLLQKVRNSQRKDIKFIMGRKSLLIKILESMPSAKNLIPYIADTSAIVLSNLDVFEMNNFIKSFALDVEAKPRKPAKDDITIPAGETPLQPGQAVTELKQAGIEVQMQKGKVVIANPKTIKKGEIISIPLAKAMHTLSIKPFRISLCLNAAYSQNTFFNSQVLSITKEGMIADLSRAFSYALDVSYKVGIVNSYTISRMLADCYAKAMALGISCNIYDKGITELLVGKAVGQAESLMKQAN